MYSNPIRPSALISLTLANTYILSPYISICSLASCFIYYTHIDIASILVLTLMKKKKEIKIIKKKIKEIKKNKKNEDKKDKIEEIKIFLILLNVLEKLLYKYISYLKSNILIILINDIKKERKKKRAN